MTSLLFVPLGFFLKLNLFSYIYWTIVFFPFCIFPLVFIHHCLFCRSSCQITNVESFPQFFQLATCLSTLLTMDFLLCITKFLCGQTKKYCSYVPDFSVRIRTPPNYKSLLYLLVVLLWSYFLCFMLKYLIFMKFILVKKKS